MRRMKLYDCFWEMRRRKLERMADHEGRGDELAGVYDKAEYSRFREERERRGMRVYRMIQEKTKKENAKNAISKNAFRTYADKCLQSNDILII